MYMYIYIYVYVYIHIVSSLNCILSRYEYNTSCVVVDRLNKQVVYNNTELGDHIHAEAEKSKKSYVQFNMYSIK